MNKVLNNTQIEVLKFLVGGKAYSNDAIIKNLGIEENELEKIYEELKIKGYLETYLEYEERSVVKSNCHSESCNNCSSGCSQESAFDKSKILVLTQKALSEFGENE